MPELVAGIAAIEPIAAVSADVSRVEKFPIRINLDWRKKHRVFCYSLTGVAGIAAIETIADRRAIENVDFAVFAVPGMLLAIFQSNFAVFAVPGMFSAFRIAKTLPGTAKTANFH